MLKKVVRTIRPVTNPIKKEDRGITRPVARSIKKVVRENEREVTIGLDRRKKSFLTKLCWNEWVSAFPQRILPKKTEKNENKENWSTRNRFAISEHAESGTS